MAMQKIKEKENMEAAAKLAEMEKDMIAESEKFVKETVEPFNKRIKELQNIYEGEIMILIETLGLDRSKKWGLKKVGESYYLFDTPEPQNEAPKPKGAR